MRCGVTSISPANSRRRRAPRSSSSQRSDMGFLRDRGEPAGTRYRMREKLFENGDDLEAKGNVLDHEFKIERGGDTVAEVSKRWFRVRDTYGIEIAPGQDDVLILAVTVCIDQMARGE